MDASFHLANELEDRFFQEAREEGLATLSTLAGLLRLRQEDLFLTTLAAELQQPCRWWDLDEDANPEAEFPEEGRTLAMEAARAGLSRSLEALLLAGAKPDARGGASNALFEACAGGSLACLRILLDAGADPAGPKDSLTSPLGAAAWRGHRDCCQALLDAGVPVDSGPGKTALGEACSAGRLDCVQLLLARGADPEGRPGQKLTPLDRAASRAHLDCCLALLEAGAAPQITLPSDTPAARQAIAFVDAWRQARELSDASPLAASRPKASL